MSTGGIFNVQEPKGVDQVRAETTAAQAQLEAPSSSVARSIEKNAEQAQEAAESAALAAKSLGDHFTGEPPSATDKLQQDASATTKAAVAEGKQDVAAATAAGQSYLDQAKSIVSGALATAQLYLPSSGADSTNAQGVVDQVQVGAASALGASKEYAVAAQKVVQPHIDKVSEYVNNVNGQTDSSNSMPSSKGGIPATSAPLESGANTVDTPYPSTTTTAGTNVGT